MKKKFFLLGFIILFLLFYYSFSEAQVIPMPNDTMKVGGGTYANDIIQVNPGQVRVPVTFYLRNTFNVRAFALRLVYDSTIMSPRTPDDSSYSMTTRSSSLSIYGGDFSKAGQITFFGAGYWTDEFIATGRGPVVEFYFNIKSNAPEGPYAIKLEDDSVNGFYNYMTDVSGSGNYVPILSNGTICVGNCAPPENHSPVLTSVSPKSVVADQTLTFSVNATDEDNDPLTLTAQNIPENASFPQAEGTGSVTGTFTFTPTAEQAPDTISVTFIVRDKYFSADTITVTIYIFEETQPPQEPTDKLKILSTEGGVPGSKGKLVPLYLINEEDTVYGVEFTLSYNHQAIIIDSILPASRIEGFSIYSNRGDSLGKLTVLIFGLGNERILPGSDTILYLAMSVDTLAPFGNTALDLISGWEAISIDPTDSSRALALTDGFFAVDRFGDVNLDRIINVADVVSLVAYILGNISLDTRHWDAADINRDGNINVGDLVGVINTILGRSINAPIGTLREPLAYLRLD
ncbi:MAG: dockerin type I domain-containing protein, partial [Candidatus Zixiibacteriota bacterium]